jgi:DNA-binding response OmpR family regulator
MRVLVIEDSVRLQRTLGTALRKSGYAVDLSGDGEEGLWLANSNSYDVIVLDLMLPKLDGLSVLADMRRRSNDVHVLLLTARDSVADRVQGLCEGADDYLVKPFALEEFLARVQALCRRVYGDKRNVLSIGDLAIDTLKRTARRANRATELTSREFLLLEYLARRQGQVVSRSEIESHIYDGQVDPMSNVVDSAVCSLRKKLGAGADGALIRTRRGFGYVLEQDGPISHDVRP